MFETVPIIDFICWLALVSGHIVGVSSLVRLHTQNREALYSIYVTVHVNVL